jgi:dolichol-phosphate mannosyltransferase
MNDISVIIPVYMGKRTLIELYLRLRKSLSQITSNYEIILVNDASPDNVWDDILKLGKTDKKVKGINLSRNFGQHYAITAGISQSTGEWIVIMDCDLQDQPEEIVRLYNYAVSDKYDIVFGKRSQRMDSYFKTIFSKYFYKVLGYLTNTIQDPSIGNFGIYNQKVIKSILSMGDQIRYFPAMVRWVGYKSSSIEIEHAKRLEGKTSYSLGKLVTLATNVMLSFSDKPLKIVAVFGFFMSLVSLLFAGFNLIRYLIVEIPVTGWTSLIISIWFLSGLLLMVLGIVGLYIGKTFEKVKNRPLYIIMDSINID